MFPNLSGVPKMPQETSVRLTDASSEIETGQLPNIRQNGKGSSQIDRFIQHSSQPYGQFIKPPERFFGMKFAPENYVP